MSDIMMKKIYDREMCQFLIGNVRPEDVSDDATTSEKTACVNSS